MRNRIKVKMTLDIRKMIMSIYMTGKKKIVVPVTDPNMVQQIITGYLKFEGA